MSGALSTGAPRSAPRSLADDLRGRTDEDLATVLLARPDLMTPAPTDMSALAARATTQTSLTRCLDSLDAHELWVLATVARLSRENPINQQALSDTVAALDTDTGASADAAAIGDAVERLRVLGLLWGTPDGLRAVTAVHELLRESPSEPPGSPPIPAVVIPTWDPTGSLTDAVAAQHAREFVGMVDELLEHWGHQPPPALRRGGLAVRDITRTCEELAITLSTAILVMELGRSAGLIDRDESGLWLPTHGYDAWADKGMAERWLALVQAWLPLPFVPTSRDERTCLTDPSGERLLVVPTRRAVLRIMAEVPSGLGATTASVIEVLNYRHPRRAGAARDRTVAAVITEGRILGLITEEALSDAGRALVADDIAGATTALTASLPNEAHSIVVQADLTVTVTGLLNPADERVLRTCADLESRGPALVARLSPASLDRGAALGHPPQALHDLLSGLSRTPLPQAVEYLLADAERRCRSISVTPPQRSTRVPPPPVSVRTTNVTSRARAIARALLAPDGAPTTVELPPPPTTRVSGSAALSALREAMHDGRSTWIEFAGSDGQLTLTLVDPIRVAGGTLTAFDHKDEQLRHFSIARIRSVGLSVPA